MTSWILCEVTELLCHVDHIALQGYGTLKVKLSTLTLGVAIDKVPKVESYTLVVTQ